MIRMDLARRWPCSLIVGHRRHVRVHIGSPVCPRLPPRMIVDQDGMRAPPKTGRPPSKREESRADRNTAAETDRPADEEAWPGSSENDKRIVDRHIKECG